MKRKTKASAVKGVGSIGMVRFPYERSADNGKTWHGILGTKNLSYLIDRYPYKRLALLRGETINDPLWGPNDGSGGILYRQSKPND